MEPSPRINHIGAVQLEASLSADAISETFRGVLQGSQRPVFVRVFAPEIVGVRLVPGRFLREFEALRDLRHPNVVELLDFGIDGGTAYTVTAFAPAFVSDVIQVYGSVTLLLALRLVQQAALGLAAAHRHGLVHGALHPGVLHLTLPPDIEYGGLEPGSVQVADIGLLRALATHASIARAIEPVAWPYLCPDVARGRTPDRTSDVYALGHILIHLLQGESLVTPASLQDVIVAPFAARPFAVATHHPQAPVDLQDVIDRAIAPSPDLRFADAGALATALTAVIRQLDPFGAQPQALPPHQTTDTRALAVPSQQPPTEQHPPDPEAFAAAEALRMAVETAPPPPRAVLASQLDVEPSEQVVFVGPVDGDVDGAAGGRLVTVMLFVALLLAIGAVAYMLLLNDGGGGSSADTGGGMGTDVAVTDVEDSAEPTSVSIVDLHSTATASASATEPAALTTPTMESATATTQPSPTPSPTLEPTPTVENTPEPTATLVPPDPTATQPVVIACAYNGPAFDGYVCGGDGVFTVTLPNCDAAFVNVGWGDGGLTQQQQTPANTVIPHQFAAAGVYQVHLEVGQLAPCEGNLYRSYIYEYVPGLTTP